MIGINVKYCHIIIEKNAVWVNQKLEETEKNVTPAGSRTRVSRLANENPTTGPKCPDELLVL